MSTVTQEGLRGLLTKAPNRGFFVRRLEADDIAGLYRARLLVEPEAVRSVVAAGEVPQQARHAARAEAAFIEHLRVSEANVRRAHTEQPDADERSGVPSHSSTGSAAR